jgi:hypothetical protein
MTSTLRTVLVAATRDVSFIALLGAAVAVSVFPLAAASDNTDAPTPTANHIVGTYGDPVAARPYWHRQRTADCGELAVADVVGELTGSEPTEVDVASLAVSTPSAAGPGTVWGHDGNTHIRNLPVLLAYYGIHADNVKTTTSALEQALGAGRKAIVLVNAETIWNTPGQRKSANHFVVVTGIDAKSGVVHLNDSGVVNGGDEQVPIAAFEQAWATYQNSAVVTA